MSDIRDPATYRPRDSGDGLIPCSQCGQASPSIKIYRFPVVVFLLIFAFWQMYPVAACPACQRFNTFKYGLINLVTMNILSPIYLIFAFFFVVRSFIRGHSSDVAELLNMRR